MEAIVYDSTQGTVPAWITPKRQKLTSCDRYGHEISNQPKLQLHWGHRLRKQSQVIKASTAEVKQAV